MKFLKWNLTFHKLTRSGFIWRIMAWVIPWTTLRCSLRLRFPLLNRLPQTWQTAGGSCTPLWNGLKWNLTFYKLTRSGFIWRIMAWVIPWTTLRCSLRLRFPLLNRFPQTWQTAGGSCTPLWNCLKWDLAFPFWVNSLAHIRHLNFWPLSSGASHWLKCCSTSPFPFPLLTGTEISDLTT